MNIFQAILLAVVEGITEFLPISSTGHMIIVSALMGIETNSFVKIFTVNIQFGCILSVLLLYHKRFFQSIDFYLKLFVAFVPAAIIGFLLGEWIDTLLESVLTVAISLILGGIILLFADNWFSNTDQSKPTLWLQCFWVGCFQCIALIPGVSRSAATILGGMAQGWGRKQAAEFSFFLAVPTMFAATAYKLLKSYQQIDTDDVSILIIGNAVAFLVGILAIRFFIGVLTRYGFRIFGYYRILVGSILLILLALGYNIQLL